MADDKRIAWRVVPNGQMVEEVLARDASNGRESTRTFIAREGTILKDIPQFQQDAYDSNDEHYRSLYERVEVDGDGNYVAIGKPEPKAKAPAKPAASGGSSS